MDLKNGVTRLATGCSAFFLLAAGSSATYTMTSQTWLRNFAQHAHGQPAAVQVMLAWQARDEISATLAHQLDRQIEKCSITAAEENIPLSTRNYVHYMQGRSQSRIYASDVVFDRCLNYAITNNYPEITAPLRHLTASFLACAALSGLIAVAGMRRGRTQPPSPVKALSHG